jgi:sulfite reductase alpha subunit-like flavoprotein
MNILILYASQTGNAEEIAYEFNDRMNSKKITSSVYNMNVYKDKIEELNEFDRVIFFCATTGNGEFPENGFLFWKQVKNRKNEKNLYESLKYSICALGDTNYSMFCFSGKSLHKRLQQLGATPILPIYCIDAVDDEYEQIEEYFSKIILIME